MIPFGILDVARKWSSRNRTLTPVDPPPDPGETCLVNQYRSSSGYCFTTTSGEPIIFGITPPDPTAKQYATIDDGDLFTTNGGDALVYGI